MECKTTVVNKLDEWKKIAVELGRPICCICENICQWYLVPYVSDIETHEVKVYPALDKYGNLAEDAWRPMYYQGDNDFCSPECVYVWYERNKNETT